MKTNISKYKFFTLLIVIILLVGCSTTKDKWINRKYHQLTAHYNAYWNGLQAYKEAKTTVDKNFKDDYTKILPIYKLPDANTVSSIKSNTDRAIEKASKVIKKHSMRFNGVEKNPEIAKSYLLIGQSCLMSKNFLGAEASFKYIISNWKKQPQMYEPMVWLALTYTKQKKYGDSEILLKEVKKAIDSKKAPKKLKDFVYLVSAENDISQGKIALAQEKLLLHKKKLFHKKENVRLKFIQGQIYLELKQYDKAYKCFAYAYRHSSDYNMQFTAKLNQALCFAPGDEKSIRIIESLEKMLDKQINFDFQDQIYYTIGEIYYKNRNLTIACKKWEQSVEVSHNNTTQKVASALRCADVYYDPLENYKKAYMYYDTALSLMSNDNMDFARIKDRHKVLSTLVENLDIITKWDSLLALSNLTEDELNAKIDAWIQNYKIEQKRKAELKKLQDAINRRNNAMANTFTQNNSKSSFYFYNPQTVQTGKQEFERIWGNRALDDNWRLEQKEEIGFSEDTLSDNDTTLSDSSSLAKDTKIELTPDKREYYTKDIPYTEQAKDSANSMIANSLLLAGYVYWQGVSNTDKAIETFLELHRRYPNHKHILPSSYHLYKIYDQIGNYPSSNYYKNKILTQYPNSEYAAMITNPDFWQGGKEGQQKQDVLYTKAYKYYNNKEFLSAIDCSQQAIDSLKIGEYIPRLLYIQALSKGKLYGADSLAENLNMIIFNYPSSDISPIIEKQLNYLAQNYDVQQYIKYNKERDGEKLVDNVADSIVENIVDSTTTQNVDKEDILDAESLVFKYKDGVYYYVVLADDSKIDVDYLQQIINGFNKNKYPALGLTTRANLFTSTYQIVNVLKFPNMDKAFEYYDSISNDSSFLALNTQYYKHFIISLQNYSTFYTKRNIEAYLKFFRLMYLNNREQKQKE